MMITAEYAKSLMPPPETKEKFLFNLSNWIARDAQLGKSQVSVGYKYDSEYIDKLTQYKADIESYGYEVIIDDTGAYISWL